MADLKTRAEKILKGLEEALLHSKGQRVLKTITETESDKEFDEDTDNPDTIRGKRQMNIKDVEQAWKSKKSSGAESPDEIVEDSIEMAKGNLMSLKRHLDGLISMYSPDNMCFAESWVQGKLNIAEDYIKAVHDYVASEADNSEDEDSKEITTGKKETK